MSTAPGPWWSDHVEVVGYSDLAGPSPTRTTGCTSCVARGSTRLAAVSASRRPGDREAWFG